MTKVFELSQFESAAVGVPGPPVSQDELDELDDLPINDATMQLIRTGKHPDRDFASRSEAVISGLCTLALHSVEDDTILAIFRNPIHKISEKPLEKSINWLRHELKRAKKKVVPAYIRDLNKDYFVTIDGSKTRVFKEEYDTILERSVLSAISFPDFSNYYCNQWVPDFRGKLRQLGKTWLEYPLRRQYKKLTFLPGAEPIVEGAYNLWRGFSVAGKAGDWSLLKDHIFRNICREDKKLFRWLLSWMAYAVQCPDRPAEVAIVLQGSRGAGKGIFVRFFGELFGQHYVHISSPKHLVGNFNAHLRDCIVLFADEALWAGDPTAASRLKALITEPVISVEPKFRDVILVPNRLHILMASNEPWVVPAGMLERRFLVLDVADTCAQDTKYFGELFNQMKHEGGSEAFLHDLQNTDLTEWNPRVAPKTDALLKQQILSMPPMESFWCQCLIDGGFGAQFADWKPVGRKYLYQLYRQHCRDAGFRHPGTNAAFGCQLKKLVPNEKLPRGSNVEWEDHQGKWVTERSYIFESLNKCRKHFDTLMGWTDYKWPSK